MATMTNTTTDENNPTFDVSLDNNENSVTLATEGTYVDKNIVFNISVETLEEEEIQDIIDEIFGEINPNLENLVNLENRIGELTNQVDQLDIDLSELDRRIKVYEDVVTVGGNS